MTVVTSGHLSTCPRMLKAADALSDAGFAVRVVATNHEPWAAAADVDVRSRRHWPVTIVNYRQGEPGSVYWRAGIRHRAARALTARLHPSRLPLRVAANAFGRVHEELVDAIAADSCDLIYGGTVGGLAAVAEAARRLRVPYALDLEDFHSGEDAGPSSDLTRALATRIEGAVLPAALFVTTSSPEIAAAYHAAYGVRPEVVYNTFPMPHRTPLVTASESRVLRLYWFSQTIAEGRGLELTIRAIARAGIDATLTVRGRPQNGYLSRLQSVATQTGARLTICHEPPASPDAMVDVARDYEVGLSMEETVCRNRDLCLPNKTFTYILAGLAVAMSATPAQRVLGADLGAGAAVVPAGDVEALAGVFARWAADPSALACARQAAWDAAKRRWHWEHRFDKGRLQQLVREAVA